MLIVEGMTAPSSLQAQPSDRFPDYRDVHIEGERYAAFDLGGFRDLLRLDHDLAFFQEAYGNLRSQVSSYEYQLDRLRHQVALQEDSVDILQQERSRLLDLWTEENRRRLECENSPDIMGAVAWGLAAVFAVSTGILAAVLALSGGV